MITVVFLSNPKNFGYDIITDEKDPYFVHKEEGFRFLFYQHPRLSVDLVYKSFLDYDKNKIFFFDQIKGKNSPISIKDHVNISGKNGLEDRHRSNHTQCFPTCPIFIGHRQPIKKKQFSLLDQKGFAQKNPQKK